jgi:hypothetical protein
MGVPQIILCALYTLSLGIHLAKHGEPKNDKYNFFGSFITVAIIIGLLLWGGFFK